MALAPAIVPVRPQPDTTRSTSRNGSLPRIDLGRRLDGSRPAGREASTLASLHTLLAGRRVLVVASTGGHLAQATKWASILQLHEDSTFVTFDSEQARGLLENRSQIHVPYIRPRGALNVVRAAAQLLQAIPRGRYDAILSTGAGLALSAVPLAVQLGVPMYYIESVSRFAGPSLTGRVLERLPRVRRYAQHPTYDRRRWSEVPSLLGDYAVVGSPSPESAADGRPLKVLVTLGTIKPYRFDRMVDAIQKCLRPGDEVIWQLGVTTRTDLGGEVEDQLDAARFREAAKDVVLTHAGVGTILQLLDDGKFPVVFARRAELGEHVDDHQEQILGRLLALGLALPGEAALTREDLLKAANSTVVALASETSCS
jgi:UDP-N-acetylglucosamine--N-acetylmuramyl-(pentapeptide) pyrophosphoryl-undecaprenol N-acetylglucosamine transferase